MLRDEIARAIAEAAPIPVNEAKLADAALAAIADAGFVIVKAPATLTAEKVLTEMRELLSCALDEYEEHNGRNNEQAHWSFAARATLEKVEIG